MSVNIGDITFDHVDSDAEVEVLWPHVGDPDRAVSFDESPEGHALRFDVETRLVGLTIIGARKTVESGQRLVVTLPSRIGVEPDQLVAVFNAA